MQCVSLLIFLRQEAHIFLAEKLQDGLSEDDTVEGFRGISGIYQSQQCPNVEYLWFLFTRDRKYGSVCTLHTWVLELCWLGIVVSSGGGTRIPAR